MRLGVVVYLAAAVAVVYFSHAVLVHGAHDAQKTFGPEKQGIVDKAKSTAQEAVHQVKDKAGHLFGKEQKLKDPEREELTDDEELLHQKDQSIMDKIKGVLHSGRETVHHGAETARRAKDVKDTVQHRATEAVVDKAKDLLTGKHTHDDHKETFGEKVKDFLHMSGTDKPSVPTKEAKEPVKELAKDYVEAKAKESARESVIDKVKDFLHLKPTPAAEGQTVGEKLKHAAEGVIAGKAVDAVVDKAKEKVREFTKDTEYAGKDDKDDSSIMDRVKDRLHLGKDSDDHATLADKANMYKEATVDAAEAGYEAFKERVDEGPTVKHEPLVQPSIIDRVKDFLHIGRSKTEQAADKVSDKAQQAADKVGDKARQAGDKVRQTADDVKAQAERASSNIRNKAADVRDDVIDAARDARDMIVDKAREASDAARDAKETLVDKARDAKDAIVDKARDAKDVIVEKARDAKDAIVDKAREGKEFVEDAVEYTQDKAKEAVEWGEEKVLDPARAKLEDKQLFDTGHEKTDSIPEEAGKYVKKQARKFGEHVLENDALNTDTDQTPTETDSSDRGILGRAKDTIQAAIKRCFARSKHSGEVIEIECDNSTSTGGFAGIYDDDRANVKFAAKQGAKNTADAAKDGAQDTVDAAREGLRKTANAAKEGLKNTAQRFVEA